MKQAAAGRGGEVADPTSTTPIEETAAEVDVETIADDEVDSLLSEREKDCRCGVSGEGDDEQRRPCRTRHWTPGRWYKHKNQSAEHHAKKCDRRRMKCIEANRDPEKRRSPDQRDGKQQRPVGLVEVPLVHAL